ncbi:MAG: hypothetical protein EP298_13315 [Gammaproteobacteria bacterium]|nr:MAG: hypothetical protein EP298_13315 [Gammaproteobacteria bacterium]UTW41742.1 hypothetical protein KFE69_09520 [bacterium SCSIO 12844]
MTYKFMNALYLISILFILTIATANTEVLQSSVAKYKIINHTDQAMLARATSSSSFLSPSASYMVYIQPNTSVSNLSFTYSPDTTYVYLSADGYIDIFFGNEQYYVCSSYLKLYTQKYQDNEQYGADVKATTSILQNANPNAKYTCSQACINSSSNSTSTSIDCTTTTERDFDMESTSNKVSENITITISNKN